MVSLLISAVALLALIAGVVKLIGQSTRPRSGLTGDRRKGARASDPERIFVHILSFAGLVAALYAAAGLVALFLVAVTLRSSSLLSATDARTRASYYLAALVVGMPLWLGCWTILQRRVAHSPHERDARERRWFLAAVFATTSVVALFGLHALLRVVLTLPVRHDSAAVADGIVAGVRLVTWGAVWLWYARLGWRERSPREPDEAHDLAVYTLSGIALTFVAIGVWEGVRRTVGDLAPSGHPALLVPTPDSLYAEWSAIAAWVLSGGIVWGTVWQYDLRRGGQHLLRVVYLYLVLAFAIPGTLAGATDLLYETLRRIFGFEAPEGTWLFLRDAFPPLLLGGVAWVYHWSVMRRQTDPPGPTADTAGGIAWPRRPAIALITVLGLALAAPAFISLLWLGLDALLDTGTSLSAVDWWRDRAGIGIAAALVGSVTWLSAWSVLQRAAAADPVRERSAAARRRLLGIVIIISSLAALGFGIALLWTVFQGLLGATRGADTVSRALKDGSTIVVALALAAYHGQIFRQDQRFRTVRPKRVHVTALLSPGAEDMLEELRRAGEKRIEVMGFLPAAQSDTSSDLTTLRVELNSLATQDDIDGALLIVHPDGGSLYPYTRTDRRQPDTAGEAEQPGKGTMDAIAIDGGQPS